MVLAAIVGLLGLVAGLAVAAPASAGEAVCIQAGWGSQACVSGWQGLDEAVFDGYVTDATDNGLATELIVYAYQADGTLATFTVSAFAPDSDWVNFTRYLNGQWFSFTLVLCEIDPWHRWVGECENGGSGYIT
ncbi:MAG TPA: hypothetical protein VFR67_31570 [Pilimelia sp.]|nr:hypothetical protein [Pilimelia sp.]